MRCRLTTRKLSFLRRQLVDGSSGIGAAVMSSLADEPDSLCLLEECRELESYFGTRYTNHILASADEVSMKSVKKVLRKVDSKMTLERCSEKAPAVAQVVECGGSWCKLWDTTLHLGTRHTTGLQALSKVLAHHGHGSKPCPLCDKNMLDSSIIAHLLSDHLDKLGLQSVDSLSSVENLLTHMVNCNIDFVYKFWKLMDPF